MQAQNKKKKTTQHYDANGIALNNKIPGDRFIHRVKNACITIDRF